MKHSTQIARRSVVMGSLAMPLFGCSQREDYNLNVILELVFASGEREVTGSTVIHTGFRRNFVRIDQVRDYSRRVSGEAVIIPMGPGRLLFGLLNAPSGMRGFAAGQIYEYLAEALPPQIGPVFGALQKLKGKHILPQSDWPVIGHFKDIKRPETLEVLDPLDLPAEIASGFQLKSAALAVTQAPPEQRIKRYLPWLSEIERDEYGRLTKSSAYYGTAAYRAHLTSFELRGEEF